MKIFEPAGGGKVILSPLWLIYKIQVDTSGN